MCLMTTEKSPKRAEEDITIYKILINENNKLYAPFKRMEYELKELYINAQELEISPCLCEFYCIEGGAYHCYNNLEKAKCELKRLRHINPKVKGLTLYKGIIPKNSQYYIGSMGDVASRQIKITEECMS